MIAGGGRVGDGEGFTHRAGPSVSSASVERAEYRRAAAIEHVRVDLGSGDITVAQQLLHGVSYPLSSRWVAKQCRSVCVVTGLSMPAW
jgi:hypothetical protein